MPRGNRIAVSQYPGAVLHFFKRTHAPWRRYTGVKRHFDLWTSPLFLGYDAALTAKASEQETYA